jgi:short-subunit dehydrogenase
VADLDETAQALLDLDAACGGLDRVIANAGIGSGGKSLIEESWDEGKRVMMVDFMGAAATLLPLIPRMVARGHGHLVGISSLQADAPLPRGVTYGAAKAGFSHLLKSADLELRAAGVDVTLIHPGFMRTPMTAKLAMKMPMALDVERAALLCDRAILRRRRLVRIPWIAGAFMRFLAALPRFLSAPLMRKGAKLPPPPRQLD